MSENQKSECEMHENDAKNGGFDGQYIDYRHIFEALRDYASELWDAAERLEAAYGVVVDALNETCPCPDGMLVLVTKPGYYSKVVPTDAA